MTRLPSALAALAILAASPCAAQSGDLTGTWAHAGTQSELVIRSSIQQRGYSMPGDFSVGGSMGPGSATNMVISTTPTPTMVRREMALIIQADGRFSWISEKSYAEGSSCRIQVRQDKLGRVSAAGSQVTFAIDRGSESATRCNGQTSRSDRSGRSETYRLTRSGNQLRVSDGTVTWTFNRQ
ncbi:hypothetical protein ACIQC9_06930 [Brevundimonas sp. NPDC092305]|uniref:hypothetical protein n=1 Tax=Brevundimonas sp. NPDC092305 TaxID=3363957 RepID=UPI0037F11A22